MQIDLLLRPQSPNKCLQRQSGDGTLRSSVLRLQLDNLTGDSSWLESVVSRSKSWSMMALGGLGC